MQMPKAYYAGTSESNSMQLSHVREPFVTRAAANLQAFHTTVPCSAICQPVVVQSYALHTADSQ
jgi:hypothetical protein